MVFYNLTYLFDLKYKFKLTAKKYVLLAHFQYSLVQYYKMTHKSDTCSPHRQRLSWHSRLH